MQRAATSHDWMRLTALSCFGLVFLAWGFYSVFPQSSTSGYLKHGEKLNIHTMAKSATGLMAAIKSSETDTVDSNISDVEMKRDYIMSRVSQMYDINGDGELDEAERAMRDLDTTGRGHLTNDKVYELMNE